MAETADDLSTPLGQQTARRKRRFRLPFTVTQALAVLLGLFLVTFAGFVLFSDNPNYPPVLSPLDWNRLCVGRVVWMWRDVRDV